MINLELILPCLKGNEDHIFYKGDTSLLKNMCKKCEYFTSLRVFMNKHYKDFRLERCCEVEIKNRGKQPEAIFVNKSNPNEKIVIEAKSQHRMFATDIKKDEKETSRRKRFEKKIINDIAKNTFAKANELLEKLNIVLPTDLESIFLRGYVLSISRIPENVEFLGKRFGVRRSVVEEILSYKGEREKRLVDAIVEKNVQCLVKNIIDCGLNGADRFSFYHEYTIDKLSFMLQKADIDSDFYVQYIEYPSGVRDYFIPKKEAIEVRMNEHFEDCKLKFSDYTTSEYKRILLIENENHYWKSNMLEILQKIQVPEHIDELWSSFYIIEEVWNERKEEYEDKPVGIEYIKIYPASN
ncbi:hypothetical protein SD70_24790 [Gordoniibacillus kamchatkensis]|uniref:Competence protein CoiA-like family protein n=1 Tax=Gordoniibacillus kamchatkensis TaxID=1590651 RepID=A0ABR5ACE5_9BACL|nr:hypothetical protein [Paenibacillus sp. VKM B-2647]KIL38672.1 hypothetical protein SD70_24790 [Paenibacillus sp. VKM B-2647]